MSETLRVELSMKAYCCHAAAMFDCWCPEVGLVREGEKERRGRRVSIWKLEGWVSCAGGWEGVKLLVWYVLMRKLNLITCRRLLAPRKIGQVLHTVLYDPRADNTSRIFAYSLPTNDLFPLVDSPQLNPTLKSHIRASQYSGNIRKTSKGLKRAFCPLKPLKLCFKAIKSLKIFKTRISLKSFLLFFWKLLHLAPFFFQEN